MPAGNGTGPSGQGPQTGRGAGFCSGNSVPGSMSTGRNYSARGFRNFRGCRGGRGLFRGFARNYFGQANAFAGTQDFNEAESLKNESRMLSSRLEAIQKRIAEIEEE